MKMFESKIRIRVTEQKDRIVLLNLEGYRIYLLWLKPYFSLRLLRKLFILLKHNCKKPWACE